MRNNKNKRIMEAKFTKGEWKIHHWKKGVSGVIGHKKEGNISYFSGDAVNYPHFSIVSTISSKEHGVQHSFEGASIAEIYDCGEESKANAKLIGEAKNLYHNEVENLEFLKWVASKATDFNMWSDKVQLLHERIAKTEKALKKATE